MDGTTDKPQDKTNDRGETKAHVLSPRLSRDLIVVVTSVLTFFIVVIAFNSFNGQTGCTCCEDTEDPELYCKRLKKIALLEERIENLTKELQDTKQSVKESEVCFTKVFMT